MTPRLWFGQRRAWEAVALAGEVEEVMAAAVVRAEEVGMDMAHSSLRSIRRSLSDTAILGTPRTRNSTYH